MPLPYALTSKGWQPQICYVAVNGIFSRPLITSGNRSDNTFNNPPQGFEINVYEAVLKTTDRLRDYFSPWEDMVSPELIRAFLSLLGDDPVLKQLIDKYQGVHSVEWVRDSLPWRVNTTTESDGKQCWLYGMDQHQAIRKHRFILEMVPGKTVRVRSLIGESIDVRLEESFESLIVGRLWYEHPRDNYIFPKIHLRTIDPAQFFLSSYLFS